eukprot:5015144-Prymnesium_polylepis.1
MPATAPCPPRPPRPPRAIPTTAPCPPQRHARHWPPLAAIARRAAFAAAGIRLDVPLETAELTWAGAMARVAPGGVRPPAFVPFDETIALMRAGEGWCG